MMAAFDIPTSPGVPRYRQRTVLDGVEYLLAFRWSQREQRWYLDLRDVNGALIAGPIALVVAWPLLRAFRSSPGLPPGELVVVDERPGATDPGLHDLGASATLVYLDAAEVTELSGPEAVVAVSAPANGFVSGGGG